MSKILIVKNNDNRMSYLINILNKHHNIFVVEDELNFFYELSKKDCDCVVLPIRGVNKDFMIDSTDIVLSDNYLLLLKDKKIFTGLISDELKTKCSAFNIQLFTYFTDDLVIKNNYITTEGIIEAIVNQSNRAIFDSKILIIGYGRLGQILAKVMKMMKANITVSARNEKDLMNAKILEYNAIYNEHIINEIEDYDFVINTVPFRVLDNRILQKLVNKDILILDAASAPFGLDHEYAKSLSIKALLLPGIPGKIAPITAGELIGKEINNYLTGGE